GIDLAQTAVINVTNTFAALLVVQMLPAELWQDSVFWGSVIGGEGGVLSAWGGGGAVLAMLLAIVLGATIGAVNGLAVARLGMPPFMVTLGTLLLFNAIAIWMTRSENVSSLPAEYVAVGQAQIWGAVTVPMVIAVIIAVSAHFVLSRTTLGSWLYAAGSNRQAAIISGVPYTRVVISAYMISAALASVGGILYSARLEGGRPTLADGFLLDIIGAAVIGGISLFGGKGTVLGAVLGAVFFVVLANGLNLLNLPFTVVFIIKGIVIILAALLDVARTKLLGDTR
ncbi:MAG: ABC transporter permease, partial [Microbacteriaceae bacterium]|nr:ABC transporter permease [Microbacteriaceae bacterium]